MTNDHRLMKEARPLLFPQEYRRELQSAFRPLPWSIEETWTGPRIYDANGQTVVKINYGRAASHIQEEYAIAETIVETANLLTSSPPQPEPRR